MSVWHKAEDIGFDLNEKTLDLGFEGYDGEYHYVSAPASDVQSFLSGLNETKESTEKEALNNKDLASFVDYMQKNPNQRFWQALRNWSGYAFIYGQKAGGYVTSAQHLEVGYPPDKAESVQLIDTYYKD